MSLGDYEHVYRVTVLVSIRSKSPSPEFSKPKDLGAVIGQDGVELTTEGVEYIRTDDWLRKVQQSKIYTIYYDKDKGGWVARYELPPNGVGALLEPCETPEEALRALRKGQQS